jgi:hypothetical protein
VNINGTIEDVKEFESRKAREDADDADEDEEADKSILLKHFYFKLKLVHV